MAASLGADEPLPPRCGRILGEAPARLASRWLKAGDGRLAIYILDRPGKERDQILQWAAEVCAGETLQPFSELDRLRQQVLNLSPRVCLIRLGREGIPGLTAAALLRQESPGTRIVFVANSSDYAIAAYELGAYGYLLSPVKQEKLQRLLVHAASRN